MFTRGTPKIYSNHRSAWYQKIATLLRTSCPKEYNTLRFLKRSQLVFQAKSRAHRPSWLVRENLDKHTITRRKRESNDSKVNDRKKKTETAQIHLSSRGQAMTTNTASRTRYKKQRKKQNNDGIHLSKSKTENEKNSNRNKEKIKRISPQRPRKGSIRQLNRAVLRVVTSVVYKLDLGYAAAPSYKSFLSIINLAYKRCWILANRSNPPQQITSKKIKHLYRIVPPILGRVTGAQRK